MTQANMQLGKQGLSENFIWNLKSCFKRNDSVKIHVLKSAGHDREKIKEIAEEIVGELGDKFKFRIVGFSIFMRKSK